MKTHIARLLAVAALVTAGSACLQAQTRAYYVNFAYDADGNRVSRTITLGNDWQDRGPSSDTTEAVHYTDLIEESEISICLTLKKVDSQKSQICTNHKQKNRSCTSTR